MIGSSNPSSHTVRGVAAIALIAWSCLWTDILAAEGQGSSPAAAAKSQSASPAVPADGFIAWAGHNAVVLNPDDPVVGAREGAAINRTIGNARVVALGEPAHGVHEPLAFRNRLFRFLVEKCGFTAIALETGLSEARLLDAYALGGSGDARMILRDGFTWGFGGARENLELVEWVRAYNRSTTGRKVRIYGFDISGGTDQGELGNSRIAIEQAIAFLANAGARSSIEARRAVERFLPNFSQRDYPSLSTNDRVHLRAALRQLTRAIKGNHATLIAASSAGEYDWALRSAVVAQQIEHMFSVLPADPPGGGLSPDFYLPANIRDAAMAANVMWALDREGSQGRLLVFGHNAHIMSAPVRGGIWSVYRTPPTALGQHLRKSLGGSLRIIATSSASGAPDIASGNVPTPSIDAALRAASEDDFILDLRRGPYRDSARAWLKSWQSLRANLNTKTVVRPREAFDAVVHFRELSGAQTLKPVG